MKLIFERSCPGRGTAFCRLWTCPPPLPEKYRRKTAPACRSWESDLSRHYQALARRAFGVCDGFYPGLLHHEVQPCGGGGRRPARLYRPAPSSPPTPCRALSRPWPGQSTCS
ncbi:MAG: hypothetical protein ACLT5P_06110 [Flavonifractor plautii]